jgi:hypothetical protein
MFLLNPVKESEDFTGLSPVVCTPDMEENIRAFMGSVEGVATGRPHVFVMSTGRCGTVSLLRLFEGSDLQPYHTYWWMPPLSDAMEMMCRLLLGNYDDLSCIEPWIKCRAAEWLGDKPMLALNHTDTIFAPLFALLHPNSRIVHLERNPADVYRSFISKRQMGTNLCPTAASFDNGFSWRRCPKDEDSSVKWFIQFTHNFGEAVGRVLGERYIKISSDRLFARDKQETSKLLDFVGSDIPVKDATDHFKTKYNEKAHKAA